jgi:hypothetical protein
MANPTTNHNKQRNHTMKTTVTKYDFREAFRTLRPDNFSYEGLGELFDYIEELEEDAGMKEIELDVIAFCVDFSEYESIEEFQTDYGTDLAMAQS